MPLGLCVSLRGQVLCHQAMVCREAHGTSCVLFTVNDLLSVQAPFNGLLVLAGPSKPCRHPRSPPPPFRPQNNRLKSVGLQVSTRLVGLALAHVLNMSGMMQWAVRQTAETENDMTSLERMLEYTKLAQVLACPLCFPRLPLALAAAFCSSPLAFPIAFMRPGGHMLAVDLRPLHVGVHHPHHTKLVKDPCLPVCMSSLHAFLPAVVFQNCS